MAISQHQTFLTCSDQLYMRHKWVSISCSSAERMINILLNCLDYVSSFFSVRGEVIKDTLRMMYITPVSVVQRGLNSQDWSTCHCSN